MSLSVRHLILCGLALIGSLASCKSGEQQAIDAEITSQTPSAHSTSSVEASDLSPSVEVIDYREWIYDPDCDMPCWGEIQVGQTTIAEAQQFLQTLPHEGEMSIDLYGRYGGRPYISWTGNPQITNYYAGQYAREDQYAFLDISYAEPISISRLIARYGNPSHVSFATGVRPDPSGHFVSPDDYSASLIFLPDGLAVPITILKEDMQEGSIEEQFEELKSEVVRLFYPPSGEGYARMRGGRIFEVASWEEGADWTYYCEKHFETISDPRELFFDCPD